MLRSIRQARYGLLVGAVALAYFLSAKFAFSLVQLGSRADASVFYPPAGIALAAVLLLGRKTAVGVVLGSLWFARSLSGVTWGIAIGATIGVLAEVLLASTLLDRLDFQPTLRRVRDVLALIGVIYLASAANATISTANGFLAGLVPSAEVIRHWFVVWLGDAVAMIVLTPTFLVWVTSPPFGHWQKIWQQKPKVRRRVVEVLLWLTSLILCSVIVLADPTGALPVELREVAKSLLNYLPFLFVVWAALRLGQRGTVLSLLVVFWVAIWGLAQNYSNFTETSAAQLQQALFQFQTFVSVMITIALVLAAAIAEQKETETILQRRIERDQLLSQSTLRIRQSLDLDEILTTTVAEVRQFIDADRAYISVFNEEGYATVVAESVVRGWRSLLHNPSPRPILEYVKEIFAHSPIRVNHDSATAPDNEFFRIYYRLYQIKASIAVALYQDGKLFGILNVNQCGAPRQWEPFEVELLEQLATQVELSIQQGRLYQQVQAFANSLEQQVQERTLQLIHSLDELRELNALKDTFIHAASHDFRTPIMGALMVLRRLQKKDGETISLPRPTLDLMIDSAERQLNLIGSLLENTSEESRPLALKNQQIELRQVIRQSLANLNGSLDTNKIKIQNLIPASLPLLFADENQLQRVFKHVIQNAVEHNPPGITVAIQAQVREDCLWCAIADNGVGMSADQCDQLFTKPFLRATQNHHRTGFGLGLYTCWQIIRAHHGEIGVNSNPNQGTEIWFSLPLTLTA